MKLCLAAFLQLVIVCGDNQWGKSELYEALVDPIDANVNTTFSQVSNILSCRRDVAQDFKKKLRNTMETDRQRRANGSRQKSPEAESGNALSRLKREIWENLFPKLDGNKAGLFLQALRCMVQQDPEIHSWDPLNIYPGDDTTFGQIDSPFISDTADADSNCEYVTSVFLHILLNTDNRKGNAGEIASMSEESLRAMLEKAQADRDRLSAETIRNFKVLPVLNRLMQSVIHIARGETDAPVRITRACLYAIVRNNLTADDDGRLRELLMKEPFLPADLEALKRCCLQQCNADKTEWRVLANSLTHTYAFDKKTEDPLSDEEKPRYANIAIAANVADMADESTVIECLYRSLDALLHSSLGEYRMLIDQTCFTFACYLNALSSAGYYQRKDADDRVQEIRKAQLLRCIRFMQEECRYAGPNYMFALIEIDSQNRNLVDGLDVGIVHDIVRRYYECIDTSKLVTGIGQQYLEWCTRNHTGWKHELVTDLLSFDLNLWIKMAKQRLGKKTLCRALYDQIFVRFAAVPLDGSPVERIYAVESDADLILRIRRMFGLFDHSQARWNISPLYSLFIGSTAGESVARDYFECVAKMILYLIHYPAQFRDQGNVQRFTVFLMYILEKISNRTWLYHCEGFKRFDRWDEVIVTDESALAGARKRHAALYQGGQRDFIWYRNDSRNILDRIADFNERRNTLYVRRKQLKLLLETMEQDWMTFMPDEQEQCAAFAESKLGENDAAIQKRALAVLDRVRDTTDDRIQKLETLAIRSHGKANDSINEIEGLLSLQILTWILESMDLEENNWQAKLLWMLIRAKNINWYDGAPEEYPHVGALLDLLCDRFASLPEDFQIALIYAVRKHTALLSKIDFSLLSFADDRGEIKPLKTCYSLWRFFIELDGGRNIRQGGISFDDITGWIIQSCFDALMTSNYRVKNDFGEKWNNVVFHILRNMKLQPQRTVNIAGLVAYKLLGLVTNTSRDGNRIDPQFVSQISDLSRNVFAHPCLHNLMTDIMSQLAYGISGMRNAGIFAQVRDYVEQNLNAAHRSWFDTDIQSAQNDYLTEMTLDFQDLRIKAGFGDTKDDLQLQAYIMNPRRSGPFWPTEPIVVVEEDGALYVIEGRKLMRRIQKIQNPLGLKVKVYRLVSGDIRKM